MNTETLGMKSKIRLKRFQRVQRGYMPGKEARMLVSLYTSHCLWYHYQLCSEELSKTLNVHQPSLFPSHKSHCLSGSLYKVTSKQGSDSSSDQKLDLLKM
ncbi:hypothetical protein KC19_10G117800 [Ceratodon purpureus]|uniref:Uncharacterized protein n=1 Tax=Ceratodon purpureus TaxID=3225 RepID=A0A8T0GKR4_CERPU|nr:hypothetical protein KC19_10G117800 [Ceratodon purpureus]